MERDETTHAATPAPTMRRVAWIWPELGLRYEVRTYWVGIPDFMADGYRTLPQAIAGARLRFPEALIPDVVTLPFEIRVPPPTEDHAG